MKWTHVGWLLAGLLTASASLRAADVTLTVNGKVVARPCTVSTVNATVELGDLYTFSLIGAGSASAWHSVALDLSNCPVGTSRAGRESPDERGLLLRLQHYHQSRRFPTHRRATSYVSVGDRETSKNVLYGWSRNHVPVKRLWRSRQQ